MEPRRARRLLPATILAGAVLALYSRPGLWSAITQAIGEFSLSYPDMDALADTMWARGAELLKSMLGLMLVVGMLEQYSNGGLFRPQPRRQRGPREENFQRAGAGAAMVVLAVYLMIAGGRFLGVGYLGLVSALLRAPFEHPPWVVWLPLAGWAVLLGTGILSLCVGINRSQGSARRQSRGAGWMPGRDRGHAALAGRQGLDREATVHLGPVASGMERKGEATEPSRVVSFIVGKDREGGQFDQFRHGYAGTIYKGQGRTLDAVYLYHSHHWRSASSYVALTRHRERCGYRGRPLRAHDCRYVPTSRGSPRSRAVRSSNRRVRGS